MGLFNKLKDILFDEETVEIPVITKEEKKEERERKRSKDSEEETRVKRTKETCSNDDEVKIEKIETPKKKMAITHDEEDLFDMPKLKEESKEEVKTKTFTFPVFDDDEKELKRSKEMRKRETKEKEESRRTTTGKRASGYTSAFDYSYGKYKGDYKSSRENSERLAKALEIKDEKKGFTPSPIISPVYGVLNENYKKEDIVSKSEKKETTGVLDLDSVRRKAYGTLEDEIEVSLSKQTEEIKEEPIEDYGVLEDDGISIDDLLVESTDTSDDELREFVSKIEVGNHENDKTDLYNREYADEEVQNEIELDDEMFENEKTIPNISEFDEDKIEEKESSVIETSEEKKAVERPRKLKEEKTEDNKEAIGEEDLFDLIDSLYEGKGEE